MFWIREARRVLDDVGLRGWRAFDYNDVALDNGTPSVHKFGYRPFHCTLLSDVTYILGCFT